MVGFYDIYLFGGIASWLIEDFISGSLFGAEACISRPLDIDALASRCIFFIGN